MAYGINSWNVVGNEPPEDGLPECLPTINQYVFVFVRGTIGLGVIID